MTEGIFTLDELAIPHKDVWKEAGYGNCEPDIYVQEQIRGIYQEALSLVKARFAFDIFPGSVGNDRLIVGGNVIHTGHLIGGLMKNATSFAVFIATAGNELDMKMQEANRNKDMLYAYLLSALGSCIAEKASDLLEHKLEEEIGRLLHTNRFSPGYCNWPLTDQHTLFELLQGHKTGVRLTSSSLMLPVKSISGIIGIGDHVKKKMYACSICDHTNCYKRKKKNDTKHE